MKLNKGTANPGQDSQKELNDAFSDVISCSKCNTIITRNYSEDRLNLKSPLYTHTCPLPHELVWSASVGLVTHGCSCGAEFFSEYDFQRHEQRENGKNQRNSGQ